MPSTASTLFKTERQATGENDGTWGTKANTVLDLIEEGVAGEAAFAVTAADVTLTDTQYVSNQARKAVLNLSGTLTGNRSVIVPARTKLYYVYNGCAGAYSVTVKTLSGTGIAFAEATQGKWGLVYCDGTNVVDILRDAASIVTDPWCGTAGGTKNALTFTPTPAITAYAAGQSFVGIIGGTSSDDAVTLAVSGLATKAVQINGSALSATVVLVTGKIYRFDYDGTQFQATRLSTSASSAATESAAGVVELATDAETATGSDTSRAVTPANVKSAYIKQGTHSIFIPATAMFAATTNGAASASVDSGTADVEYKVLDFDTSTQEFAHFSFSFPKSWDEGTVTFAPYWTAASGTGGVVFALQAVALSNDDAIDTAFGTEQTSTDTLITAADVHIGPTSSAITIAGTPAAEDLVFFRIKRNVSDGSDTLAVDARLLGVKILFTINAADDS